MTNQLQVRLEVQGAVQSWIDSFMLNNGVSASVMEDALNKALVSLKDKAIQECIIFATMQTQSNVAVQIPEEEKEN